MSETKLRDYDFTGRLREKNGLSYVSWADIWDVILQVDANASYHVHQFQVDEYATVPYQQLGVGAMVYVDVTIAGTTRTGYLPVMDHKNKTIAEPTATDVNNTIQRCLAKAAAMHGLGLYVYRGEDTSPALEQQREAERAEAAQAAERSLRECGSIDDLQAAWKDLNGEQRQALAKVKDEVKASLAAA